MASDGIVILCRVADVRERVRVAKLLDLCGDKEVPATVYGLHLESAGDWQSRCDWVSVVGRRLSTLPSALLLPIWICAAFGRVLRKSISGYSGSFFCVGLDSALPVWLASRLNPDIRYVFDNPDNFSKSYRLPSHLANLIDWLEGKVAVSAIAHVVPGGSRWSGKEDNLWVIPNLPTRKAARVARAIAGRRGYFQERTANRVVVYTNGWLTEGRGALTLLRAARELEQQKAKVKIVVAGKPGCEAAQELIRLSNVEYHGLVSNKEALALYYKSHFAFTFYDPRLKINREAEPNKWGDCLISHTPFLVNKGIVTSQKYEKLGVCKVFDYDDYVSVAGFLQATAVDFSSWKSMVKRWESTGTEYWDDMVSSLLGQIFRP